MEQFLCGCEIANAIRCLEKEKEYEKDETK